MPLSHSGDGQLPTLDAVLNSVRNARLLGVRYVLLPGSADVDYGPSDVADEVEHAVELQLDGATITLAWQMKSESECLGTSISVADDLAGEHVSIVDVSSHSRWISYIGKRVADLRTSWHASAFTDHECPWAATFVFEDGASFTVSLGELVDGSPTYLPDSLVVLFGREAAERYKVGDAGSSWGNRLRTS